MKHFQINFQTNLLIVLAFCLCGLCVYQWYEQTVQRNEIVAQNGMIYERNVAIQDATNSIATLNHQVEQMDAGMTALKAAAVTNEQLVVSQKARLTQLQFTCENFTNEVTQYQDAVNTLEARLEDAYADIRSQNLALTNLVAQRDAFVNKYNDSVKDRNDVVAKYNDLVSQMQKPSSAQK